MPSDIRRRIADAIDSLQWNPRPTGTKKLDDELYRVRVGAYRILYRIEDDVLVVLIVKLGHRRDVYRWLKR